MLELEWTRQSAVAPVLRSGCVAENVNIGECAPLILHQVAAWPDSLLAVKQKILRGGESAAELTPQDVVFSDGGVIFWLEPLKFWILGAKPPEFPAEQGMVLDLSHAFSHVLLSGSGAVDHLQRHLPLDLRMRNFEIGATAASIMYHVPVRLWRAEDGYHLLLPRSFARSVCQLLCD